MAHGVSLRGAASRLYIRDDAQAGVSHAEPALSVSARWYVFRKKACIVNQHVCIALATAGVFCLCGRLPLPCMKAVLAFTTVRYHSHSSCRCDQRTSHNTNIHNINDVPITPVWRLAIHRCLQRCSPVRTRQLATVLTFERYWSSTQACGITAAFAENDHRVAFE